MPTYTYKREDGSTFEWDQRITEDAINICPTTGQKVKRIISGGAGLVFKGSGFYSTDYGKAGSKNGSQKSQSDNSEGNNSTDSKKPESKSTDAGTSKEKAGSSSSKED